VTSKPLNVLFCEHNVDGTVGGSYYSLLYLVKGLSRSRFRPIVVFYTDHSLMHAFKAAGVETVIWPQPAAFTFGSRLRGWRWWLGLPLVIAQKALNVATRFVMPAASRAWFLVKRDIAIVHLNNSVLYNHDWMLAALVTRRRCVTHERGINERYSTSAKFFGKRIDNVICISEAVRQQMRDRGADSGNLVTIHNGLDPDAMRATVDPGALRREYELPDDTVVIGMVGNIRAWKGQETLVRAIAEVIGDHPNVRCFLVGDTSPSDRAYETKLRRLIQSLKLEDHIVFTGFQRQVTNYLMMFDVMVHASVSPEPFGRVVLEAMACRKPFIGSRAGAIPELVEEGVTGLTFPPGDAPALAQAIRQVLADPDEARRMGERGYDRLVREFHIDRNTEATERLYEEMLRAHG
jgi:glycosyltransferase involved in cell wall biosynthesis